MRRCVLRALRCLYSNMVSGCRCGIVIIIGRHIQGRPEAVPLCIGQGRSCRLGSWFIGRNVDLTDWLFNVLGIGAVLGVLEVRRLRRAAALRAPRAVGAREWESGRPTR